jgi:hypothetical protein
MFPEGRNGWSGALSAAFFSAKEGSAKVTWIARQARSKIKFRLMQSLLRGYKSRLTLESSDTRHGLRRQSAAATALSHA